MTPVLSIGAVHSVRFSSNIGGDSCVLYDMNIKSTTD